MFDAGADFSKMTASGEGKLKVDNMKHKTFVDVNELGTEAAGVTGKKKRVLPNKLFIFERIVRNDDFKLKTNPQ